MGIHMFPVASHVVIKIIMPAEQINSQIDSNKRKVKLPLVAIRSFLESIDYSNFLLKCIACCCRCRTQAYPRRFSFVSRIQCSRQRSRSTQAPLAIHATWEVISRWKILPELFQSFETLAGKGKERKGTWTHQLLQSLALHARSNGQQTSQVQTDTTVVLHAPSIGLRLERERGLNNLHLPQNSSSYQRLQFLSF